MNLDTLNLVLQFGTLAVGAYVTMYPPTKPVMKFGLLAVIVACGVGGLLTAYQASQSAEAKRIAAQAEIVRLTHEGDRRVSQVQERLEDVSSRLAAKGIAADVETEAPAATALDTN